MKILKNGKIFNSNGLFFEVNLNNKKYNTKISGKVKKQNLKPKVGDIVDIKIEDDYEITNENQFSMIEYIHPRLNNFERPSVSNIDKAIIISSCKEPNFDFYLLLKFITIFQNQNIEPILLFSKYDLLNDQEKKDINEYINFLSKIYPTMIIDNTDKESYFKIFNFLNSNDFVIITGQTGVGKSTFLNNLDSKLNLKTNQISKKLNRGKHTTRDYKTYLIKNILLIDSPGFSSLNLDNIKKNELYKFFLNYKIYNCKFQNCTHTHEPDCELKKILNITENKIEKEANKIYLDIFYKNNNKFI